MYVCQVARARFSRAQYAPESRHAACISPLMLLPVYATSHRSRISRTQAHGPQVKASYNSRRVIECPSRGALLAMTRVRDIFKHWVVAGTRTSSASEYVQSIICLFDNTTCPGKHCVVWILARAFFSLSLPAIFKYGDATAICLIEECPIDLSASPWLSVMSNRRSYESPATNG